MFRKSNPHKQASIFDSSHVLTRKMQERLHDSWAETFRQEVFVRIPEEVFAVLFSTVDSRPNAPINVLVGGDILKAGFGWSDAELEERLEFDLLTRHALGLDDLGQEAPTLRTSYNLRRRVREHAEETGENLYNEVFAAVTEEQIAKVGVNTHWQRVDSVQLLSNIARLNRLELVLSVLQKGVGGLPAEAQAQWKQEQANYLSKPAQNICYRLKKEETEAHLLAVGQLLWQLATQLHTHEAEPGLVRLVERTLGEQYQIEEEEKISLRPAAEISGDSLQSPHDEEATYRQKRGESYKGYVVNISESCDPENEVQLITSVQTATNVTDDGQLLARALDEMAARQIEVDKVTSDGGYNGPVSEEACRKHQVQLQPTTIRGGQGAANRFGWEAYTWILNEEGRPVQVSCPGDQTVPVKPARKGGRYLVHFAAEACATCPFFQNECRVEPRTRSSPTLNVTRRSIQVATLRQGMSTANAAIRANVEATIHAFKHPFADGKLPVRGLIRAHMMACGSALMVNLRRLHAHLHPQPSAEGAAGSIFVSLRQVKRALFGFWTFLRRAGSVMSTNPGYFGLRSAAH